MFQLQGFKGRLFNDLIYPCNNEAAGPGRITTAEWLRVAFQCVLFFHEIGALSFSGSLGSSSGGSEMRNRKMVYVKILTITLQRHGYGKSVFSDGRA